MSVVLQRLRRRVPGAAWLLFLFAVPPAVATPAHRAALERHYDRFLPRPLAQCRTCHLPSDNRFPDSLDEFPHNPFGNRLREFGEAHRADGKRPDLSTRLAAVAMEDADGDGVQNQLELMLGTSPGDPRDTPDPSQLSTISDKTSEFDRFLSGYRWRPFEPVVRPTIPHTSNPTANPVDAFLDLNLQDQRLTPRPEASREILVRRIFMDLVGLNPTPAEQDAFLNDTTPGAYERLVTRLLSDPRHGERWARHWMDVWRYSDWAGWTDGNQVRDSKPHIWRWRDWIVEACNTDRPYDRMLTEMLAADELAPEDADALRATGFLARNFKLLSREQWLEDTVKHTFQAFLGLTMGCAKCHDHMADPVSQREYFAARAIFEPHQIRLDRVPGELDTGRNGLARAYDATNAPTYLFVRGDERHPLTNEVIAPGVPSLLGGQLRIQPVPLPDSAQRPDHREFVRTDTLAASQRAVADARKSLGKALLETDAQPAKGNEAALALDLALKKHSALLSLFETERARESAPNPAAATNTALLQRIEAVAQARLNHLRIRSAFEAAPADKLDDARRKLAEAETQLTGAIDSIARPLDANFTSRSTETYPAVSTGRRSAFAQWITGRSNPLTARVAVNHVWLRHFGRALVPSPADFGRNGQPASHPQLLDWLAAEFMEPSIPDPDGKIPKPWSLHHLHRLMVTSQAYRRASTPDPENLQRDPDNIRLWRMNPRRLEAEAIRDNLLHVAGSLDTTMGGPDIDHREALTSQRRSLYLRNASEKQAEFLQIFDGPSVTECYERRPSVIPQQALALGNSDLAIRQARLLGRQLLDAHPSQTDPLIHSAFARILGRRPTPAELQECSDFLSAPVPVSSSGSNATRLRTIENLVLVLINHSDFVTVR